MSEWLDVSVLHFCNDALHVSSSVSNVTAQGKGEGGEGREERGKDWYLNLPVFSSLLVSKKVLSLPAVSHPPLPSED